MTDPIDRAKEQAAARKEREQLYLKINNEILVGGDLKDIKEHLEKLMGVTVNEAADILLDLQKDSQ